MINALVKFVLLALFVFVSYNWLLVPQFPQVGQYVGTLGLYGSLGASAALMMCSMLFGKRA